MGVSLSLHKPQEGIFAFASFIYVSDEANYGEVQADVLPFLEEALDDNDLSLKEVTDIKRLMNWLLDDTVSLEKRTREEGWSFGDWTVYVSFETHDTRSHQSPPTRKFASW